MALYRYTARTAWPTTSGCSRTGRCDWLYSGELAQNLAGSAPRAIAS